MQFHYRYCILPGAVSLLGLSGATLQKRIFHIYGLDFSLARYCMASALLNLGIGALCVYLLFAFISLNSSDDILDLKLNFTANKRET